MTTHTHTHTAHHTVGMVPLCWAAMPGASNCLLTAANPLLILCVLLAEYFFSRPFPDESKVMHRPLQYMQVQHGNTRGGPHGAPRHTLGACGLVLMRCPAALPVALPSPVTPAPFETVSKLPWHASSPMPVLDHAADHEQVGPVVSLLPSLATSAVRLWHVLAPHRPPTKKKKEACPNESRIIGLPTAGISAR